MEIKGLKALTGSEPSSTASDDEFGRVSLLLTELRRL